MTVEPLYTNTESTYTPSSAIGFLRGLLTVLWYGTLIALVIFMGVLVLSLGGIMGLDALNDVFTKTTPAALGVSALGVVIYCCVLLVILKQLRRICDTLRMGDPFVPENANRLRTIWVAVAIGEALRLVIGSALSYFVQKSPGTEVDEITLDLRIYVWFSILALIILSEVFREGARLRQEQKFTV